MRYIAVLLLSILAVVMAEFKPIHQYTHPNLMRELEQWSDRSYLIFCYHPSVDGSEVLPTNEEYRDQLLNRTGEAFYYEVDLTAPETVHTVCPVGRGPAIVYINNGHGVTITGPMALRELDDILTAQSSS